MDKIYYVNDPLNGLKRSESVRSWWRRALRDPKVLKDGSVLFIPGPPVKEEDSRGYSERKYRELVETQMGIFCKNYEGEEAGGQLTLKTAISQKRIIVVKLPYSDMKNLPPQVESFKQETSD